MDYDSRGTLRAFVDVNIEKIDYSTETYIYIYMYILIIPQKYIYV
jgi:hypothetical protein